MSGSGGRRALGALAGLFAAACGAGSTATPPAPAPVPAATATSPVTAPTARAQTRDTTGAATIPVGYGRLRQDSVSVRLELVGGVVVQATPLDESVIRLLAPDTYQLLHRLVESQRARLDEIGRRYGQPRSSVWDVTYYGTEQGEARFSPQEFIVTNVGRDFRPLDVIPLTPGFGEQRLRLRDRQRALFVLDGTLDVSQPLTVTVEGRSDASWNVEHVQMLDRERALIRSRARTRP